MSLGVVRYSESLGRSHRSVRSRPTFCIPKAESCGRQFAVSASDLAAARRLADSKSRPAVAVAGALLGIVPKLVYVGEPPAPLMFLVVDIPLIVVGAAVLLKAWKQFRSLQVRRTSTQIQIRLSQSHDRPHPPEPRKAAHRGHAGSKIAACSRIGPHSGAFWSGGSRLESSQASYWLHWSMSRTPESSTSSSSCRSAGCCCFQPHGQQTDG